MQFVITPLRLTAQIEFVKHIPVALTSFQSLCTSSNNRYQEYYALKSDADHLILCCDYEDAEQKSHRILVIMVQYVFESGERTLCTNIRHFC